VLQKSPRSPPAKSAYRRWRSSVPSILGTEETSQALRGLCYPLKRPRQIPPDRPTWASIPSSRIRSSQTHCSQTHCSQTHCSQTHCSQTHCSQTHCSQTRSRCDRSNRVRWSRIRSSWGTASWQRRPRRPMLRRSARRSPHRGRLRRCHRWQLRCLRRTGRRRSRVAGADFRVRLLAAFRPGRVPCDPAWSRRAHCRPGSRRSILDRTADRRIIARGMASCA